MTDPDTDTPVHRFSLRDSAGLFVRGLAMGAADVVPGVSGGTIAFITGIYERFVDALKSLSVRPLVEFARGRVGPTADALRAIDWATLLPLGLGIVTAILALSGLILGLMESSPGPTYALFFGLIAASAWLPIARMRRFGVPHGVAILLASVGAFLIVGLTSDPPPMERTASPDGASHALVLGKVRAETDAELIGLTQPDETLVLFDPKQIIEEAPERTLLLRTDDELEAFVGLHDRLAVIEPGDTALPYILLCGVIAISAMILPGLSGSFLLLLLGVYHVVFGALHRVVDHLKELLGRQPDALTALSARTTADDALLVAVFLVGVVIGLGLFSRVVSWLFHHYHDVTMAALTGLMIGALRLPVAQVMGDPDRVNAGRYWPVVVIVALLGAGVVLGLHYAERKLSGDEAV
ncbi:MAG: hypothetical protein Tsb0013_25180 [Phycisphaerales bacterium]